MAETLKKWEEISRSYRVYIKLEKRLSENTVESYMRDLRQFAHFILRFYDVPPRKVEAPMIERYLALLYDQGREKTSQARALSGIRSFYNYLMLTDVIDSTPTQFIDTPKFGRHLPDILTVEEIDRIVAAVDTSTVKGRRDSAMLEVLYSCGLRVSELTSLRLGDLFFGEGYIRVTGKGDKQRLVPVSGAAREKIQRYLDDRATKTSASDVVFLNNRGTQLTRVMVFTILREAVHRDKRCQEILDQFNVPYTATTKMKELTLAQVQMVEIILKKVSPALYQALGVFLPLITTNCCILGVAILVIQKEYNLLESVVYAISTAIGFALALVIFAGIREQLALTRVPEGMKGTPIALITAGLLAMAFMGFSGIV